MEPENSKAARKLFNFALDHLPREDAKELQQKFHQLLHKNREPETPEVLVRERGRDTISIALQEGGEKKAKLVLENHLSKTINETDFQLEVTGEKPDGRRVFVFERHKEEKSRSSSSMEEKFENLSESKKLKKLQTLRELSEGADV